jgi:hypothetical protein
MSDLLLPHNPDDIEAEYRQGNVVSYKKDPIATESLLKHLAIINRSMPRRNAPLRDTFLYRYLARALGTDPRKLKTQYQKRGTCAGQGGKICLDVNAAVQHVLFGKEWAGRYSVAEYAEQAGRWDGAAVSWIAGGKAKVGALLLKDLNLPEDALDADEELAYKWASSSSGVPVDFEKIQNLRACEHLLPISNIDQAAQEICNGNPLEIGSTVIPRGVRNKEGIADAQRSSGGHAVGILAVRFYPSSTRPYAFLYWNSWGPWGQGPLFEDQPEGTVWISANDMQAILDDGDTYADQGISGIADIRSKQKYLFN